MLNILFFISFKLFSAFSFVQEYDVQALRNLLNAGSEKEEAADELFKVVGSYAGENAVVLGYKASAYALRAKYSANPITKLKSINTASDIFTKAVSLDSENVELRFMRYAVEAQTPGFLSNLKKHIAEDQQFLIAALLAYPASGFTPETGRIARDFILKFGNPGAQEQEKLRQLTFKK